MASPLVQARVPEEYKRLAEESGKPMSQFVREAFIEKCERDLKPKAPTKKRTTPKKAPAKKATETLTVKRVRGRKVVEEQVQIPAASFTKGHCPHRFASVCEDCQNQGKAKRRA